MPTRMTGAASSLDRTNKAVASGVHSHAEGAGNVNVIAARYAHAEGGAWASAAYAHAEGNNTLAGAQGSHAEGNSGGANGSYSHVEGDSCSTNGSAAHAEGYSTQANGSAAHAEGYSTQALGGNSHAEGAYAVAARYSQRALGGGRFAAAGDALAGSLVMIRATTDATQALLTSGGSGTVTLTGEGTNVLTLATSRIMAIRVTVAARRQDVAGDAAMWTIDALAYRDANTGQAALFAALPVIASQKTPGAASAGWDATVAINSTNGANNYLAVLVTGAAGQTIRWAARADWVEVG